MIRSDHTNADAEQRERVQLSRELGCEPTDFDLSELRRWKAQRAGERRRRERRTEATRRAPEAAAPPKPMAPNPLDFLHLS